jgi:hypothetical protein
MPRRTALFAPVVCAFAAAGAARADEDCMTQCLRECKQLVPGNDGYCEENCKTACVALAAKAAASDPEPAAAKEPTAGQDDDVLVSRGSESVGIFGRASDSGVERFAASIFGATKQGTDVRVADRDAFVNDIVNSFKDGVLRSR